MFTHVFAFCDSDTPKLETQRKTPKYGEERSMTHPTRMATPLASTMQICIHFSLNYTYFLNKLQISSKKNLCFSSPTLTSRHSHVPLFDVLAIALLRFLQLRGRPVSVPQGPVHLVLAATGAGVAKESGVRALLVALAVVHFVGTLPPRRELEDDEDDEDDSDEGTGDDADHQGDDLGDFGDHLGDFVLV